MKKISFVILFFISCFVASAQSTIFKPFKVDLALGYAIPGGSGSKGGVLFAIEPKYAVNDQMQIGMRIEGCLNGSWHGRN